MTAARLAPLVLLATACVPAAEADVSHSAEVLQPVRAAPAPTPTPSPTPTRAAVFTFDGELEQGGWIRGTVPGGTREAQLGEEKITFDEKGRFFAAFDRDAPATLELTARLEDGRTISSPLAIARRAWNIEHVNVARRPGGAQVDLGRCGEGDHALPEGRDAPRPMPVLPPPLPQGRLPLEWPCSQEALHARRASLEDCWRRRNEHRRW